ncbi:hypothetical protein [Winogradskyella sp. SYSU M77433]|uniref:hypothetical protein n=1 Tax=Winogradskyella sp. SYSU M77433 TaxID=3042722 RepID=UPI00248016C0|nr:hypothetical protein [Winogradskyella sp. SYSU M77433]MDH7913568.1 hypothetical protein [Winogradskyella sp. SYSU M77433]
MKYFYLLIIFALLFSCNSMKSGSVPNSEEWVDVNYSKGVKFLNKRNLNKALKYFHSAQLFDSTSSKSKKSKEIIDSLLPMYRKDKTKRLSGRWKLKELNFNPYPGSFSDIIEITDSLIKFYQYKSDSKFELVRKERIKYSKYNSKDILFDPYSLEFENGEIWLFEIERKLFKNKLYPTIEKGSDGYHHHVIDERSLIINRKARRKTLKEETYTFYVKEK